MDTSYTPSQIKLAQLVAEAEKPLKPPTPRIIVWARTVLLVIILAVVSWMALFEKNPTLQSASWKILAFAAVFGLYVSLQTRQGHTRKLTNVLSQRYEQN